MLDSSELKALLNDLEADNVERTTALKDTDKFSQAVCAFANDLPNHRKPGYLIIGAHDDGRLCGLKVTDQLLQNLAALRSDGNILPLPMIVVKKFSFPEGELAVVEVQGSDLPPVRYKGQIYVRVGPRKAIASEQEERILAERRLVRAHSFDATPVAGSAIEDLSLALFSAYRQQVVAPDVIESNHRSIQDQLASLRFFDPHKSVPTVAGILLFGKAPLAFLPGAYIQYLKLPGPTLTERPIDSAEISGDLFSVLRELDLRIKSNIQTTLQPVSILREETVYDYPQVALREYILNAVMHRDYHSHTPIRFYWFSDHIEIQSPGGLYGEVTKETLRTRSSYRNPVVAEAMKALGYVNRYGYGIQRAEAALQQGGNPPPDYTGTDDRVFSVQVQKREPVNAH